MAKYQYLDHVVTAQIESHTPSKWIALDLKTGDLWRMTKLGGWRRATRGDLQRARKILAREYKDQ